MKKVFKFIITFLIIGLESLGNMSAVTVVLEENLIKKNKYVREDDLIDAITLARLGPGATTSNMVAFLGNKIAGFWGGFVATVCYTIVPLISILLIINIIDKLTKYEIVMCGLRGCLISICIMLCKSILDMWDKVIISKLNFCIFGISLIMVAVFDIPIIFTIICSGIFGVLIIILDNKNVAMRWKMWYNLNTHFQKKDY